MRTVHTADLTAGERAQARAVVDAAFGDRFAATDWAHALGGLHVLAETGSRIVAHASVVQRALLVDGVAMRAGYVEAVAVHPDHQRLGYATALMDEVERIIRAAYDIGALSASSAAAGLYARRGWLPWPGKTAALTPDGLRKTPGDDGSTYVLPVVTTRLEGVLACDFRPGDLW
ncbi:GNAT family N-acetyltransferase [Dactylosporangium salmoneum]|uniref:Aminoglycoside N-acetyltransferase AAC(2')-Ic n=1 Tax=Dactylosporangium salmoneum TaxID=53361 RepID=A0ABP5ST83_9ACTN